MITIHLPEADAAALRDALARHAAAEVDAGCEPSGYRITVSVEAVEGAVATLELGSQTVALGRADVFVTGTAHSAAAAPPPA